MNFTGAFDRVIDGIALRALHIIGFATSITRMIGITWSKRKCNIKTGSGVCESFYQSSEEQQTFGIGQGCTATTDIWFLHGIIIHTVATYFIGISIL
jgi:hypothetical protein